MSKKYNFLSLFYTIFEIFLSQKIAPKVKIEQGLLIGKVSNDGLMYEYVGIPYGTTNISNRFQAPLDPPSWIGIFNATDESSRCPQIEENTEKLIGTEDCLKLNVYVPVGAQQQLPVMVYVHGGCFIEGSGDKELHGPEFLVRKGVILVTFDYRLGALGYLCLGIKEAPGNAGMKDQVAALKWVKKNILAFGGDPDNITIFGHSAGATAVSYLLASETTEGLFNKAIEQSGSSLLGQTLDWEPIRSASLLAKKFGHATEDPYELYKIFVNMKPLDLVSVLPKRPSGIYLNSEYLNLPCIEKTYSRIEPFLTDLPYNMFTKKPKNVSVIYGTNSNEGLHLISKETKDTIREKNNIYLLSPDLKFSSINETEHIAKKIKEYYFGNHNISTENLMTLSTFYKDHYYEVPAILEAEIAISKNNASVYNYYFDYAGERNFMKISDGYRNEPGASHADELLYLFDGRMWKHPINDKDNQMIEWMTTMWTNFAKYGDPTPPQSKSILPFVWLPSSRDELRFLYIDDSPKMGQIYDNKTYNFWKEIYLKYRKTEI